VGGRWYEQIPWVEVLAEKSCQNQADGGRSGALVSRVIGQTFHAQASKERPAAPAPQMRTTHIQPTTAPARLCAFWFSIPAVGRNGQRFR